MTRHTTAEVLLPDGTHVNHTPVKDSWCWWYRKYAPVDTVLEGLERAAREAKNGLWADSYPVPPWEWRKGHRVSRQTLLIGVAVLGSALPCDTALSFNFRSPR